MESPLSALSKVYDASFRDPNYIEHLRGVWEMLGDTPLRTIIRLAESNFSKDGPLWIADLGCGEGRDLAAFSYIFSNAGFTQTRLFGCEISNVAAEICRGRGFDVECTDMQSFLSRSKEPFSILWAHFSLIHMTEEEIGSTFSLISTKTASGSIFGVGFKAGDGSRLIDPKDNTCLVDRETTYFRYDFIANLFKKNGIDIRASISVPSSNRPVLHQYAWVIGVKS